MKNIKRNQNKEKAFIHTNEFLTLIIYNATCGTYSKVKCKILSFAYHPCTYSFVQMYSYGLIQDFSMYTKSQCPIKNRR